MNESRDQSQTQERNHVASSDVLCRQRIEQMIESYHDLWIKKSIEAVEMMGDKDADYRRGLSQGCAIAYEGFVRNLREIRDEWRHNSQADTRNP